MMLPSQATFTACVDPEIADTKTKASKSKIHAMPPGHCSTPPSLTSLIKHDDPDPALPSSAPLKPSRPLKNLQKSSLPGTSKDIGLKDHHSDSDYNQGESEDSEPNELNDLSPEMIYEEKPEGQESEEHSSKGCTDDDEKESSAASTKSALYILTS